MKLESGFSFSFAFPGAVKSASLLVVWALGPVMFTYFDAACGNCQQLTAGQCQLGFS